MTPIKTVLHSDHSRLKKAEIVELLTGLNSLIGDAAYSRVSGIDPATELSALTKADLLKVVEDFQGAYDEKWERSLINSTDKAIREIFKLAAADENLFSASNASSADFAAELGSIDFEKLIGGPMNAAVNAQTSASMATVNFIKEVGFTKDATTGEEKLKMADFSYFKEEEDPDDSTKTISKEVKIEVPFISILSIPSLRIETLDIDFNVKLNSTFTKDVTTDLGIDAEVAGGWGPVKMKVSASYQRTSSTGIEVKKEYSMGVKVRATNDEMPAGLEKVLGLMAE